MDTLVKLDVIVNETRETAKRLKALNNLYRQKMLQLLIQNNVEGVSMNDFVSKFGRRKEYGKIAQHIKILKEQGIIVALRTGNTTTFYPNLNLLLRLQGYCCDINSMKKGEVKKYKRRQLA